MHTALDALSYVIEVVMKIFAAIVVLVLVIAVSVFAGAMWQESIYIDEYVATHNCGIEPRPNNPWPCERR